MLQALLPEVSTKLLHRPSQEYPLRLRLFTHGTKGTVGIFGAQNLAASVMGADQLQNLPLSTWLQTFCDELLVPWQYQEECVACTNVTTKFVGHAPKSLWKAHPPYATRSYTSRWSFGKSPCCATRTVQTFFLQTRFCKCVTAFSAVWFPSNTSTHSVLVRFRKDLSPGGSLKIETRTWHRKT